MLLLTWWWRWRDGRMRWRRIWLEFHGVAIPTIKWMIGIRSRRRRRRWWMRRGRWMIGWHYKFTHWRRHGRGSHEGHGHAFYLVDWKIHLSTVLSLMLSSSSLLLLLEWCCEKSRLITFRSTHSLFLLLEMVVIWWLSNFLYQSIQWKIYKALDNDSPSSGITNESITHGNTVHSVKHALEKETVSLLLNVKLCIQIFTRQYSSLS